MYLVALYLLAIPQLQAQYSEQKLIDEANSLFEQGSYAEAMTRYAQLLSLNPTNPDYNFRYGATALYGDASKKAEAIKFLRFATSKPNIDNRSWYFLGRAYHLNYQFADAIRAYEKYVSLVGSKEAEQRNVSRELESCRNGLNLLSSIKEVVVLDKKQSQAEAFFRLYDLSDIGGKILVTPDELLSSLDKKRNHKSLIHFRGIGSVVYFSSYGKDGKNGLDIYMANVLPDGKFSTPVPVPGQVNTPFDEDYPFMHPDNVTFYFSSKGHTSMGGYDVFRSPYSSMQNVFGAPENLDFAVNTPDDDIFYIADSLNNLANFASARSSRQGELHVYKVQVSSVPMNLTLIKGSFANKIDATNKTARITVVDAATNREVAIQFTDPETGDYLLSFPRSGKYKFLVEAKNSQIVHSGLVDIPASSGISAYLQEMELITTAGVEKLLINNLFDREYMGDIAELTQKLLRQKAELEINFDQVAREEVVEKAPVVTDKFSMAYNDAGFGAGKSNGMVLAEAGQRTDKYAAELESLRALIEETKHEEVRAAAEAQKHIDQAHALIEKAIEQSGDARNKSMFDAGIAKLKAENAIRAAQNTKALGEKLALYEKEKKTQHSAAVENAKSLEKALQSGDYETALAALKTEKQIRESIDKTTETTDVVSAVRIESLASQKEANRKMESAARLRTEAESTQTKWLNKQRQREKLKGKEADAVDKEIAQHSAEYADLKAAADRAFTDAEKLQQKAFDQNQQYEIVADLKQNQGKDRSTSPATTLVSSADLTAMSASIAQISPDKAAVSAYLKSNPDAVAALNNDAAAMAFRKNYAVDDTTLASTESKTSDETKTSDELAVDGSQAQSVTPDSEARETQSKSPDSATETALNDGTESKSSDTSETALTDQAGTKPASTTTSTESETKVPQGSATKSETPDSEIVFEERPSTSISDPQSISDSRDDGQSGTTTQKDVTVTDRNTSDADLAVISTQTPVADSPSERALDSKPVKTQNQVEGSPDAGKSITDGKVTSEKTQSELAGNTIETSKADASQSTTGTTTDRSSKASETELAEAAEQGVTNDPNSQTIASQETTERTTPQGTSGAEATRPAVPVLSQTEQAFNDTGRPPNEEISDAAVSPTVPGTPGTQNETTTPTGQTQQEVQSTARNETATSDIKMTPGKDSSPDLLVGQTPKEQIASEQSKIQAAQDWVSIIDESIAELETAITKNPTDKANLQGQLAEYKKLKSDKENEIAISEQTVANLQIVARAEQQASTDAVVRAENDVAALDPATITRLEQKMPDVHTKIDYIRKIDAVDGDYLPELTSIELSGLSAPEIAEDRIVLNEHLIASLDKVIASPLTDTKASDELIELRRIKVLELKQDRAILVGSVAYAPRSAEAKEYTDLITKDDSDAKPTTPELAGSGTISAEQEVFLNKPYTRDLVMPGYQEKIEVLETETDPSVQYAKRIQLREQFLKALQAEIALVSAMKSPETGKLSPGAEMRYEKLLSDRFTAVDELEADKIKLARILTYSDDDDLAEVQNDTQLNESDVQTPPKDGASAAFRPEPDHVAVFDSIFETQMIAIRDAGYSPEAEMKALASLNAEVAAQIETKVDFLIRKLDSATDDTQRDVIQYQIQQLDDIAADKLQESDRLYTEAETYNADLSARMDGRVEQDSDEGRDTDELTYISPDNLQFAIEQPSAFKDLDYQSLNANVKFSQMQTDIEAAELNRQHAKELLNAYLVTEDPAERKRLSQEFHETSAQVAALDRQLNEDIETSNKAEIDYFKRTTARNIEKLEAAQLNTSEKKQLSMYQTNFTEVEKSLEENRRMLAEIDPSETVAHSGFLKLELDLIEEMGVLNKSISSLEKSVTARTDFALVPPTNPTLTDKQHTSQTVIPVAPKTATGTDVTAEGAENFQPLQPQQPDQPQPDRSYITPITSKYADNMSVADQQNLIGRTAELQVTDQIPTAKNDAERLALIRSKSRIDETGAKLLQNAPNQMKYLAAVVIADSLRKLEENQATLAKTSTAQGVEKQQEAERLENMAKLESVKEDKDFLTSKAKKLISEAEVHYQVAAIASQQAENLRSQRTSKEQEIATIARKLPVRELAELNQVIRVPGYSIVHADLTSAELAKADERIDEPVPTGGNWLALVEIIAEKTNFSDVKETMFIEAPKPLYTSENPIPIDVEMPMGLIFQVQVGAYRNKIPQDLFGQFAPVMGEKLDNGITRYRAGLFTKYREAVVARNGIRAKGYTDAFVVAYLDGEKLTASEAALIVAQVRDLENFSVADEKALTTMSQTTTPSSTTTSQVSTTEPASTTPRVTVDPLQTLTSTDYYNDPEAAATTKVEVVAGLFFTVQVGVYSKPVKLDQLYNLTELNSEFIPTGKIRYTTGRFGSVSEAGKWKQNAITSGVTDAFITAYFNGKRIGLAEAQAILDKQGNTILATEVGKSVPQARPEVTPSPTTAPSPAFTYVVVIGKYSNEVPRELANLFLDRPDLNVRRITDDKGLSTYLSPEFQAEKDAIDYLRAMRTAGITSARLAAVRDGEIILVEGQ